MTPRRFAVRPHVRIACGARHDGAASPRRAAAAWPSPPDRPARPGASRRCRSARSHHPDIPYQSPTSLGAASYAKVLCSGVFVSGRDEAEIRENSAFFLMTEPDRKKPVTAEVDRQAKRVRVTVDGVTRTAAFYGDQGCVIHPEKDPRHSLHAGAGADHAARRRQPAVADGRCARATAAWPATLDRAKVQAAVDLAFADPAGLTAAMVVVHKGQIVGERYMAGITKDTQLESWSMGKSLTATLVGLVVKDGAFALDDPAPVPDWRRPGDPRGPIRVRDVMQMSSGLSFTGQDDRWMDPTWQYHDHFFIYAGAVDAFKYATTSPVEFAPGTVGRYRNSDPMTLGFLVRQAVEKKGEAVPDLAAAGVVRPHRHPAAGARARSLGQLPAERLRLRHGAQLGAARAALPAGRHVERPAAAARGLGHLRAHAGAGVEAQGVRRPVLGERRRASGTCRATPTSCRAPAGSTPSSCPRTTWWWCGWATSAARRWARSC